MLAAAGLVRRCGRGGGRAGRGSARRDEASIGVLPFENRSGDSAQAYLSEGVSDELTARLSAVPELKVSPRSSTVRFRGSTRRAGGDRAGSSA